MVALCAAVVAASLSVGTRLSAGCKNGTLQGPLRKKIFLDVADPAAPDGVAHRHFWLNLPSSYKGTTGAPLVLNFHGFYDTPRDEMYEDSLPTYVEQNGLPHISVYPAGSGIDDGEGGDSRSWNVDGSNMDEEPGPMGMVCHVPRNPKLGQNYQCYASCKRQGRTCHPRHGCTCASCFNDTKFIQELLDHLEDNLCIDLDRVHATGISAGGLMTYQVGLDSPERWASIAPVAGSRFLGFNFAPRVPVSLLATHGTQDTTVPANITHTAKSPTGPKAPGSAGPNASVESIDFFYYTTEADIVSTWAGAAQCDSNGILPYPMPKFDGWHRFGCYKAHGNCANGVDIVQCVGHWGHTWPLHKLMPNAYAEIVLKFFDDHPKNP